MGKNSDYNKKLNEKRKAKLRELEAVLPNYAVDYLDEKELTSQINTAISYAYDLQTFFRYLIEKNPVIAKCKIKDIPEEYLDQLTYQDINDYQKYLEYNDAEQGEKHVNSISGVARRMAALRGMYQFICLHGYIVNNPTLGAAKRSKDTKKDIIRLEKEEVGILIDKVERTDLGTDRQKAFCKNSQLRDYAIIYLLLNTGIRVSECVGLDIEDVNFRTKMVTLVRKGGADDHVYMNEETANAVINYIENERKYIIKDEHLNKNEKALFLSNRKQRMCVKSVENVVKKYAKIAVPDKKITCHKLRSTFGTALYKETGDIRLVADTLGHKDINTTAKAYSAIDEEHKKKAASVKLY